MRKIKVGAWRDDAEGPMEIVSGRLATNAFISKDLPPIGWNGK